MNRILLISCIIMLVVVVITCWKIREQEARDSLIEPNMSDIVQQHDTYNREKLSELDDIIEMMNAQLASDASK